MHPDSLIFFQDVKPTVLLRGVLVSPLTTSVLVIVMLQFVKYTTPDSEAGNGASPFRHTITSTLVVKGEDHLHTAMARTVGLPLGIAARLILEGKIRLSGLHIPIVPEIYEPVLKELAEVGIQFEEKFS